MLKLVSGPDTSRRWWAEWSTVTVSILISAFAALLALLTWLDNHQAIDQQAAAVRAQANALEVQREALDAERVARQREIDILDRQTQFAGARLRPIVVPGRPLIRSVRVLPNGAARLALVIVNESGATALQGQLSVGVVGGFIPDFLPFGPAIIEQRAGLAEIASVPARASRTLSVTVPARVLRMRRREGAGPYTFVFKYRDTIDRTSRTFWNVMTLRVGEPATAVTLATKLG